MQLQHFAIFFEFRRLLTKEILFNFVEKHFENFGSALCSFLSLAALE